MSRAAANKRRQAHLKAQRRKKQESELARLEAGGKHRPWWKVRGKGPETKLHQRRVTSLKSKLGVKPKSNQTDKDISDARKEQETANLSKIKGKPSKDPGPGRDKKGNLRTATLEEDRKSNAPKKKNDLKPAPWGRNEDGSPRKQPSASSQIATHKKSVQKSKEEEAAAKKKKYESDQAAWIKKTRNSPAQRSGRWKGQEHKLYEQHLRHKAWKESRKKKKKK